jgi:hypothetical protein
LLKTRFPLKREGSTTLYAKLEGQNRQKTRRYIKIVLIASATMFGGILIGSYYHEPIGRTITLIGGQIKSTMLNTFDKSSDVQPSPEDSTSPNGKPWLAAAAVIGIVIIGIITFKDSEDKSISVEVVPSFSWVEIIAYVKTPEFRIPFHTFVGMLLYLSGNPVLMVPGSCMIGRAYVLMSKLSSSN